jgi:glycosyltransferase involved in cell wall biosynthesis
VALTMVDALRHTGLSVSCRDVPTQSIREHSGRDALDGLESFATTIVNLPIDLRLDEVFHRAGLWRRPGVKRIASAWWELEQVPPEFAGWAADYDEIWAPTRFIADAIQRITSKPVRAMLPGLELPAVEPLPKERFGIDPHAYTFLFVFDFNSRMPRKNPLGLIRAFRQAFRRSERVQLVIKVSAGHQLFHDHRRQLQGAADREGVRIIDAMLTRGELLGLTACCDCYVSLHRSEGFGLTIAEAMLLGKPAIATGYSGNLDFMTPDNSRLVDYRRVPIVDDIPPYPKGFLWAEPSVEHAAELMRWMYEHPAESRTLGERAQHDLRELLSLGAYGRRLREAL